MAKSSASPANYTGTSEYVASRRTARSRQRGAGHQASLATEGRTRNRQNSARRLDRPRPQPALAALEHQIDHQGAGWALRYDTVQRLNDSRFGDGNVADIQRYIKLGKLGQAFVSEEPVVLLIDEIDKADLEFPNDLLAEIDEMRFHIPETDREISTKHRPMVVITSNSEKELPDPFFRRCVFHFIEFPKPDLMADIVKVHFPDLDKKVAATAMQKFFEVRARPNLKKLPSTSELIDWIHALLAMGMSDKLSKIRRRCSAACSRMNRTRGLPT